MASSGWKKEEGKIVMDVVVPPNTTATIEFPNGRKMETGSPARSAGSIAKKNGLMGDDYETQRAK
jgi:hypothetical protein